VSGVACWFAVFRLVEHHRARGSKRTIGADVTRWRGSIGGERLDIRVTPRPRVEGEHFLTSSAHRLRDLHVGRGGYFLDVEILTGPAVGPAADAVRLLMEGVEREEGTERPVRLRARAERFRTGKVGQDVFAEE
jgi:hypothetical protein